MSNPKVSIILTTHGSAPYLKQAIGSVLAQTFEDWELIVAVDYNNEKFLNCLGFGIDECYCCESRIKVRVCDVPANINCRFARTINEGFLHSTGEYITYLCHDDLYLPWRLSRMLDVFTFGARDTNIVFGWQKLFNELGDFTQHEGLRRGNPDQPSGTVDHSSVMHRRECFEKAGGWDESAPMRYGDAYFWMRLQNAGYKFHCIPEVLDCHRFNRESITWKEDHPILTECK